MEKRLREGDPLSPLLFVIAMEGLISLVNRAVEIIEYNDFHINEGRVVLLNAVLNAMPIYTLPFYKAPTKVLQEIYSLQSNFLWRGNENKITIQ